MDDQLPLAVGTEVSAKYRGAFCEAKVKVVERQVVCRVEWVGPPRAGSAVTVSSDAIRGTLRIGSTVEARDPQDSKWHSARIKSIRDNSMYTVVFDDGDVRTLRRTGMQLKGKRHFSSAETLDALPLVNPENFGAPIVRGGPPPQITLEQFMAEIDEGHRKRRLTTSARCDGCLGIVRHGTALLRAQAAAVLSDRGVDDEGRPAAQVKLVNGTLPRDVVFVDPMDETQPFWWPAMVRCRGCTMQRCRSGRPLTHAACTANARLFPSTSWMIERTSRHPGRLWCASSTIFARTPHAAVLREPRLRLRYTCACACAHRATVDVRDTVPFSRESEKFKEYSAKREFRTSAAVKRALEFIDAGTVPPGFKWPNWELKEWIMLGRVCSKPIGPSDGAPPVRPLRMTARPGRTGRCPCVWPQLTRGVGGPPCLHKAKRARVDARSGGGGGGGTGSFVGATDGDAANKAEPPSEADVNRERRIFFKALYGFMMARGTPITQSATLGGLEFDLFLLHTLVRDMGGAEAVSSQPGAWSRIVQRLFRSDDGGDPPPPGVGEALKAVYDKFLLQYALREKAGTLPPVENDVDDDSDAHSSDSSASDIASPSHVVHDARFKHDVGDLVVVTDDSGQYDAKVVAIRLTNDEPQYRVHFYGWNSRFDTWVSAQRIRDATGLEQCKSERPPPQVLDKPAQRHKEVDTDGSKTALVSGGDMVGSTRVSASSPSAASASPSATIGSVKVDASRSPERQLRGGRRSLVTPEVTSGMMVSSNLEVRVRPAASASNDDETMRSGALASSATKRRPAPPAVKAEPSTDALPLSGSQRSPSPTSVGRLFDSHVPQPPLRQAARAALLATRQARGGRVSAHTPTVGVHGGLPPGKGKQETNASPPTASLTTPKRRRETTGSGATGSVPISPVVITDEPPKVTIGMALPTLRRSQRSGGSPASATDNAASERAARTREQAGDAAADRAGRAAHRSGAAVATVATRQSAIGATSADVERQDSTSLRRGSKWLPSDSDSAPGREGNRCAESDAKLHENVRDSATVIVATDMDETDASKETPRTASKIESAMPGDADMAAATVVPAPVPAPAPAPTPATTGAADAAEAAEAQQSQSLQERKLKHERRARRQAELERRCTPRATPCAIGTRPPANTRIAVATVAKLLAPLDPDGHNQFTTNEESILERLRQLHRIYHELKNDLTRINRAQKSRRRQGAERSEDEERRKERSKEDKKEARTATAAGNGVGGDGGADLGPAASGAATSTASVKTTGSLAGDEGGAETAATRARDAGGNGRSDAAGDSVSASGGHRVSTRLSSAIVE